MAQLLARPPDRPDRLPPLPVPPALGEPDLALAGAPSGSRALVIESRLCIAGTLLRVSPRGAVLKMPFPLVPKSRCTVRVELPSGVHEAPARIVRELSSGVYAVEFDRSLTRVGADETG